MSFTQYTQTDYKRLLGDGPHEYKGIIIESGQAAASAGTILILEESSSKYHVLGAITAKTGESITNGAADSDEKVFIQLASAPILPGTVTITCTQSGSLATYTDNALGMLDEAGNSGFGHIDYKSGNGVIHTDGALLSSDTFVGAYTSFLGQGDGMDIEQLAMTLEETDASEADVYHNAVVSGQIVAGNLAQTITLATEDQYRFFQKAGFRLISDTDSMTQS